MSGNENQDSRTISLEGMANIRDLGGLRTEDGQRVKKGLFLRADHLHNLTEDGIRYLSGPGGVTLVIDFRTDQEKEEKPDREIPGASYYHIPLFVLPAAGVTREEETVLMDGGVPDMPDLYRKMVMAPKAMSQLRRALSLILHNETGASLFHCTAGKDRTGVTAMMILGTLGVSEEDIMEDYLITNVTGIPIAEKIASEALTMTGDKELAERIREAYIAREKFLGAALDVIHSSCGTIGNYMAEKMQFTPEEIRAFQERSLE